MMPVGVAHDVETCLTMNSSGNIFVKQVTHRIHENGLGLLPSKRQFQHVLLQGELKPVGVIRLAHGLQALRHPLGVAVLAARADLRAPVTGFHVDSVHSIVELAPSVASKLELEITLV